MQSRTIRYIALAVMAALMGCESEVDMQITPVDSVVMSSFFSVDSSLIVSVYGCTPYTDTVGVSVIENATVTVSVNGHHVRSRGLQDGATKVDMGRIDATAGDEVEVQVEAGEAHLSATTHVLQPVEIIQLDTATTKGYEPQLRCRLSFDDPAASNDYYQIEVKRHMLAADGSQHVKRLPCNYNDYLFLLTASAPLGGTDLLQRGLFDDAIINGKSYTIGFSIEWQEIRADVADDSQVWIEILFYHHTADYYKYQTTAAVANDFLLLPLFGQENVYSNVSGGYGIFTSMTAAVDTLKIQ